MTQGLGSKLGALLYASNQTPVVNNLGRMRMSGIGNGTGGGIFGGISLKPLAISPERITRSSTVYAVFAIE